MNFLMTDINQTSQEEQFHKEQFHKGQLEERRKRRSRKKLPVEEKIARQKQSWQKKHGGRFVFQARTDKEGKEKIKMMREQLGFRSNDLLLEWFLERGERSLARRHSNSAD